jgi:hypothetical protein
MGMAARLYEKEQRFSIQEELNPPGGRLALCMFGKRHDLKDAQSVTFPSISVLVVDRAFVYYQWFHNLDCSGVFYVTRLKSNVIFKWWKIF